MSHRQKTTLFRGVVKDGMPLGPEVVGAAMEVVGAAMSVVCRILGDRRCEYTLVADAQPALSPSRRTYAKLPDSGLGLHGENQSPVDFLVARGRHGAHAKSIRGLKGGGKLVF